MHHASEFRRCLLTADVAGIMRVWQATNPHLPQPSAADALIQLHMARVEAKTIPRKMKDYSIAFLDERGYRKIRGQWVHGAPKAVEVALSVGIASKSNYPAVKEIIERVMQDALLNEMAKGTTEPEIQREKMLGARAKRRFKLRMA